MPPLKTLGQPGRNKILLAASGALVILALVIARVVMHHADAADKAQAQPPAVPVVTANAAKEDVPIVLTGIGTVQAAQSVTVKVRVDGQLEKIAFTEGQDVKEGDLLAQIDPRPFQAALDQAIAQKAHDDATLANAQKDLERYTTLFAQDSIQQQTLDTQKATVNQLKASVQSDQAQIDNAKVQLAYTTIRAPVSGRTGLRLVDAGNIVHATDTTGLVVINQIDPISVLFTLPEEQFQQVTQAIQASGRIPLTVNALARNRNVLGAGHLLLVNNQIDTQTGTFQLKASFPNRAHALWPGQLGASPSARLRDGRRARFVADAHPVHHAGGVSVSRSRAAMVHAQTIAQEHPDGGARTGARGVGPVCAHSANRPWIAQRSGLSRASNAITSA